MPQSPYPGALEIARTARVFGARRAKLSVGWKRHRQGYPNRYTEPIVLFVTGGGDTWAAYLNRMMRASGMTRARLAELAGLTRQTISEWANGKGSSTVKVDNVLRVAAAFGDDPARALNAAAGLTRAPAVERDPDVELILSTDWSDAQKVAMIERMIRGRSEAQNPPPGRPNRETG